MEFRYNAEHVAQILGLSIPPPSDTEGEHAQTGMQQEGQTERQRELLTPRSSDSSRGPGAQLPREPLDKREGVLRFMPL